jgi:hypothetical protein
MRKQTGRRNSGYLLVLILLCLGYSAWLHFHYPLTGTHQIDGILGVLLGLFSASQPAANILDLVLYGQYESVRLSLRQATRTYWTLNLLLLLAGWIVISTSLLRYSALT